jgi:hypothetical protein
MNRIIKICVVLIVLFVCSAEVCARIVAIGDLPKDHDPSLVLRKGRTIKIALPSNINSETPFGGDSFRIEENVYDDSGQFLLLPSNPYIYCLYRISAEQDKFKITITAMEMILFPDGSTSILFSDPPRYKTGEERFRSPPPHLWRSGDKQKYMDIKQKLREEYSRTREHVFLSPTMRVELILSIESEDHTPERGKIIFGENASGDRTVAIEWGYEVDLQVKKDILFSAPFIGQWTEMLGIPLFRIYW